jgi:lipid-binding SYLF domain-containing protein
VTLVAVAAVGISAQVSSQETDRIRASSDVLHEIRGEPDKDIPQDLWAKARCVVVVPSLKKAAFGIGGEYGKGMMSCRNNGEFGAPVFMQLEKGSWGFQIGGESIDLVLLVMNEAGMKKMLQDKVSLGADASVAAGPVGRNAAASTDAQMTAEVLSYSRAQGLFAGIDVSGGVLRPDVDANHDLYGHDITASGVLSHGTKAPESTRAFMNALRR